MTVCLDTYYTVYVGGCDKDVLSGVSGQQESSVCYVFVGIMIHINNLTGLPYCPFILFSSLPLDIPICFHFHKWAHCVQKTSESRRKSLHQKEKWEVQQQQADKVCVQLLHSCTLTCAGMSMPTNTDSRTQRGTFNEVSR